MYRVMIVDDEYYIRKSFRNRINWIEYDMVVVGEASNGDEAYHMIPEYKPDLMFVDIRMPILDGFDLTSLLTEEYPAIYIIIISAYNDFHYAKAAIENGVFDYLLKPLEEEEVGRTLQRLLKKMEAAKKNGKVLSLYNLYDNPCKGQALCCIAFFEVSGQKDESKQAALLREWLLEQGEVMSILGHNVSQCQIFCLYGASIDRFTIKKKLQQRVRETSLGSKMIIGISEVIKRINGVKEEEFRYLVAEAVEASKDNLFDSEAKVFLWSERKGTEQQNSPYHSDKIEIVRQMLSKKDYAKAGKAIISYINSFKWEKFQDVITVETIVGIVLEQLFKAGWDCGIVSDVRVHTNEFHKPNYLLMFQHPEEVRERLCSLVEVLMEEMSSNDSSDLIQRMVQYIEENYSRTLQMEDFEKEFFMSQSSLLMAFKKKKNMTISNYIEAVRMEKAKELLKSRICSVQDTAQAVGYLDANYFCKVFKRYAGVTPSKYRMK